MNLDNLIKYRENNLISQKQIVETLGISKGTYSAWESGNDIIPLNRLNDVCNILGISVDYALGLANNSNYIIINKDLDLKLIGNRLKYLRKRYEFTLAYMAKQIHSSPSILSRYENGKTLVLTTVLFEYAKFFGISVDYILNRIDYIPDWCSFKE